MRASSSTAKTHSSSGSSSSSSNSGSSSSSSSSSIEIRGGGGHTIVEKKKKTEGRKEVRTESSHCFSPPLLASHVILKVRVWVKEEGLLFAWLEVGEFMILEGWS